jgi:predicted transcriptional regulator
MTITLPDEKARTAEKLATANGHASVNEFLESLIDAAQEKAESLAAIREGLAQADAGLGRPLKEAWADMARKLGFPPPAGESA